MATSDNGARVEEEEKERGQCARCLFMEFVNAEGYCSICAHILDGGS
jgi:hypothetical protein